MVFRRPGESATRRPVKERLRKPTRIASIQVAETDPEIERLEREARWHEKEAERYRERACRYRRNHRQY